MFSQELQLEVVSQCARPASVDRKSVLEIHNRMRSAIAQGRFRVHKRSLPPAANMMQLHYDCNLEESAQEAADRCLYKHTDAIQNGIGENVMFYRDVRGVSLESIERKAMSMWAEEFEKFGFPRNHFDSDLLTSGTLHAYQMAWAETTRIGCGAKLCERGTMALIFCHYKAQIFTKRATYTEGEACSKCPSPSKCNNTVGLCR